MARNPHGTLSRTNMERGRKHRKEEDHLRGLNHRGRVQAIADQLDGDEPYETVPCELCREFNCLQGASEEEGWRDEL